MDCSIVIRAYNEEKHIGRLLDGIGQQTIKDFEIIVVDSGSTDQTTAIATGHPLAKQARLRILNIKPDEFTFGYSLNRGIAAAKGELVVIASAHVYPVYPDWLERLLSAFENLKVALTYGRQRGDNDTLFSEQQIFSHWFPEQSQAYQANPFCNNANAAIRRSLWELHPYDETLTGLEELDWARWALNQSYWITYIAEAEVVHVHNETPEVIYNRYRREAMAFKRIFPEEHFHAGDFLRLVYTNIVSDLWNATRRKVLRKYINSIFWFRWMQFWGTYQGSRHSGPITQQLRRTFYYPTGYRSVSQNRARDLAPIRYSEPD